MKLVTALTTYCIDNGIIQKEDADWFTYGMEKRLSSLLIGVPFFLLACMLSGIWTAATFFASFYWLRSRTNGYHTRNVASCLLLSLLLESAFMLIFGRTSNMTAVYLTSLFAAAVIFILAPFDHPAMGFDRAEYRACQISSRVRTSILLLCILGCFLLKMPAAARGIVTGMAMTAFLLCLAYITNGGKHHDKEPAEDT